jgi:hypothetical protein
MEFVHWNSIFCLCGLRWSVSRESWGPSSTHDSAAVHFEFPAVSASVVNFFFYQDVPLFESYLNRHTCALVYSNPGFKEEKRYAARAGIGHRLTVETGKEMEPFPVWGLVSRTYHNPCTWTDAAGVGFRWKQPPLSCRASANEPVNHHGLILRFVNLPRWYSVHYSSRNLWCSISSAMLVV